MSSNKEEVPVPSWLRALDEYYKKAKRAKPMPIRFYSLSRAREFRAMRDRER